MTVMVNNNKKILNVIIILFLLFILFSYVTSKIDRSIKKDIVYEILLKYTADNDLKIDIKDYYIVEMKVNYNNYLIIPLDSKKQNLRYLYSFETKQLSVFMYNNIDYNDSYYYDYDDYIKKYNIKILFGKFFTI